MITVESLLAGIDVAGARFDAALAGIPWTKMESAPDGGWTIKDILGHIAAWNEYLISAMDGRGGPEAYGVAASVMANGGEDPLNEAMVARWSGMPLDEVMSRLALSRRIILERIAAMDPALLEMPFNRFDPANPVADGAPLGNWLQGAVVNHGDDHLARVRWLAGQG